MGIFGREGDIQQTPYLESVLPPKARLEIETGRLPLIRSDRLMLGEGENCHYADRAIYEKKIKKPRGVQKKSGLFRNRDSSSSKDAIVDILFQQLDGFLYITNRRVLFSGEEYWERPVGELLAAKPYLNCIKLQFGKDSYKIFVPDGSIAHMVLSLLGPREKTQDSFS